MQSSMRRTVYFCFSFVVLFICLVAAKSVDQQKFVFAISGNPDTLDPYASSGILTFQVTRSIYDTLVEPDQVGNILPALAYRWEVSDDGLSWKFFLRDNVYFHHGKKFSAQDVQASIQRILDKSVASPNADSFSVIKKVETRGSLQVIFHLKYVYVPFLAVLASGWAAILPKDLIQKKHNFATQPIGTGPFQFQEWIKNRYILLQRFSNYWGHHSGIYELQFAILSDPTLQVASLLTGNIQGIDMLVEPEVSRVRESQEAYVYKSLSGLVLVIAMNTRVYPFDSLLFRQAVNAAIDKEKVLDLAYGGGVRVQTFMDANNPYSIKLPVRQYNPRWARTVFRKFKLKKTIYIKAPRNFDSHHVRAAQMYQEMLRQAGLPVKIELLDWTRWLSEVYRRHDFDMTVIGHAGKLDPARRLLHYGTGKSYVGWVNKEFVKLTHQAERVSDIVVRKKLYAQALRIIGEGLPFIYIGTPHRYIGLSNDIKGFRMNSQLETFDFRYVTY